MKRRISLALAILAFSLVGVSNPSLASKPKSETIGRYKTLETLARALYLIQSMYIDPDKVSQDALVTNAIQGIVGELDPHTMLMPRKAFDQLTRDTQGKFGGVGIIVSEERGKLIVISPIEDTPAMKAGVLSGDEIVAIDDVQLDTLENGEAVELMRGAPGSTLKLTVRRKGESDLLDFALVREIIKVKSVRSRRLSRGLLYTRITSFQEETSDELMSALLKNKKDLSGLILDLRDNPGGLLEQAVRVVDLFVESGVIVSTVGKDRGRVEREFAKKRGTYAGFPIIVLVNTGSASASEIVAGALQDHKRAIVMGERTFGKGSVQTLMTLPDGSGLKLTIARYYTPNDKSIQAKGISPDIEVKTLPIKSKKRKQRTEADLKGHIEGGDLSDQAKQKGFLKELENWPQIMKEDVQLVTAFKYLKGYSLFQGVR